MAALKSLRDEQLSTDEKLDLIISMPYMPVDDPFIEWAIKTLQTERYRIMWLEDRLADPKKIRLMSSKLNGLFVRLLGEVQNLCDDRDITALLDSARRVLTVAEISLENLFLLLEKTRPPLSISIQSWADTIQEKILMHVSNSHNTNKRKTFEIVSANCALLLKFPYSDFIRDIIASALFNSEVASGFVDILTTLPKITAALGYQKDLFLSLKEMDPHSVRQFTDIYLTRESRSPKEQSLFIAYVMSHFDIQDLDSAVALTAVIRSAHRKNIFSIIKENIRVDQHKILQTLASDIVALPVAEERLEVLSAIIDIDVEIVEPILESVVEICLKNVAGKSLEILCSLNRYFGSCGKFQEYLEIVIGAFLKCDIQSLKECALFQIELLSSMENIVVLMSPNQYSQLCSALDSEPERPAKKTRRDVSAQSKTIDIRSELLKFVRYFRHDISSVPKNHSNETIQKLLTCQRDQTCFDHNELNLLFDSVYSSSDVSVKKQFLRSIHVVVSSLQPESIPKFVSLLAQLYLDDSTSAAVDNILRNFQFSQALHNLGFHLLFFLECMNKLVFEPSKVLRLEVLHDNLVTLSTISMDKLLKLIRSTALHTQYSLDNAQQVINLVLVLLAKLQMDDQFAEELALFALEWTRRFPFKNSYMMTTFVDLLLGTPYTCKVLLLRLVEQLCHLDTTEKMYVGDKLNLQLEPTWKSTFHLLLMSESSQVEYETIEKPYHKYLKKLLASSPDSIIAPYQVYYLAKIHCTYGKPKSVFKVLSKDGINGKLVASALHALCDAQPLEMNKKVAEFLSDNLSKVPEKEAKLLWKKLNVSNDKSSWKIMINLLRTEGDVSLVLSAATAFFQSLDLEKMYNEKSMSRFLDCLMDMYPRIKPENSHAYWLLLSSYLSSKRPRVDCISDLCMMMGDAISHDNVLVRINGFTPFEGICRSIGSMMRHDNIEVMLANFIYLLGQMLHALRSSRVQGHDVEEVRLAGECLQRCFTVSCHPRLRKITKKHAHYVLLTFTNIEKTQNMIHENARESVLEGIFCFMDVTGDKEIQYISNMMDSAAKEVYQTYHDRYKKEHKYKLK